MSYSITAEAYEEACAGIAVPASQHVHRNNRTFVERPSLPKKHEGIDMRTVCEPTPRKFRGGRTGNKSRIGTDDLADWLAEVLRNKAAKEIADDAGCGIRTAENAKQGRHTLSAKHLANMQMNDPDFAAAWAEYVGLILPGDAEYAGAMTRAVNVAIRRKEQRGA